MVQPKLSPTVKVTGPVDGPGAGAGTVLDAGAGAGAGTVVGAGTGLAVGGEPLLLGWGAGEGVAEALLTTLIDNFWPREQCDPKVQM